MKKWNEEKQNFDLYPKKKKIKSMDLKWKIMFCIAYLMWIIVQKSSTNQNWFIEKKEEIIDGSILFH